MATFKNRIIGAALLRAETYEEVESDKEAMGQAIAVIILAALSNGIGQVVKGGLSGLIIGAIIALAGWFLWAYLTYIIGTKLLPEPETVADPGEMLRTIGFASSPGLLQILVIMPIIGRMLHVAISVWMLVAMVVAVKQALDYASTVRAVLVCLIGWIVYTIIFIALFHILGSTTYPV